MTRDECLNIQFEKLPANLKQKTPLHLRLTCDDWVNNFHQLDRSELGVFYYIKTLDPFGDRIVEFNSTVVAEALKLHRTSVSRALKSLAQKGMISLEVVTARVSTKVSQKVVCMDAQEVCMDAQEVCMGAQEVCMGAQEHNMDRAREQTIQTNTNFNQTDSYKEEATAKNKTEILQEERIQEQAETLFELPVLAEIVDETEEPSCSQIVPATFIKPEQMNKSTGLSNACGNLSEREIEILKQAHACAFNPAIAPWRDGATIIKPEVQKAVFDANPQWYSSGNGSVNLKKISDRIKSLEHKMRGTGAQVIEAYTELMNYVNMAQTPNSAQVVKDKNEQVKQSSIRNRLAALLDEADRRKAEGRYW